MRYKSATGKSTGTKFGRPKSVTKKPIGSSIERLKNAIGRPIESKSGRKTEKDIREPKTGRVIDEMWPTKEKETKRNREQPTK